MQYEDIGKKTPSLKREQYVQCSDAVVYVF